MTLVKITHPSRINDLGENNTPPRIYDLGENNTPAKN